MHESQAADKSLHHENLSTINACRVLLTQKSLSNALAYVLVALVLSYLFNDHAF